MTPIAPFIDCLIARMVNREDLYYVQWAGPQKHGYKRIDDAVTQKVISDHLVNEITIGLPAMDREALCKWCCWDNDHENGNLDRIEKLLRFLGFNPLREAVRPGREGHLWLFFDEKVAARDLRRFDRFIRENLSDLVIEDELEFKPEQDNPCNANGVRMPLGLNLRPSANRAEGWFEGPPKNLEEQLIWFCSQPLDSGAKISTLAEKLYDEDAAKPQPVRESFAFDSELSPEDVFADLDPIQHGEYFSCLCPGCGQRTAYFYHGGNTLLCNRKNNCGYKASIQEWIEEES